MCVCVWRWGGGLIRKRAYRGGGGGGGLNRGFTVGTVSKIVVQF